MSVLIVGSIALDSVETPFGRVERALGGSAIYASLSASHYTPVDVIGVIGQDFPNKNLKLLKNRGIGISGIEIVKGGKTFHWSGFYENDLNQAITRDTQLNVFANFEPILNQTHQAIPFVFLANIHPSLQLDVLEQVNNPKCVMCDTMNYWIENTPDLLERVFRKVDIIVLNDAEAKQFCNSPNLHKAAKELLKLGPQYIVIKKGEHGCLLFGRDLFFSAPAYPLEVIKDPTGAGDTFAGGFIGWLSKTGRLNHTNLRKAVIVGSAMASFVVEDFSVKHLVKVKKTDIQERCQGFSNISRFPRINFN